MPAVASVLTGGASNLLLHPSLSNIATGGLAGMFGGRKPEQQIPQGNTGNGSFAPNAGQPQQGVQGVAGSIAPMLQNAYSAAPAPQQAPAAPQNPQPWGQNFQAPQMGSQGPQRRQPQGGGWNGGGQPQQAPQQNAQGPQPQNTQTPPPQQGGQDPYEQWKANGRQGPRPAGY